MVRCLLLSLLPMLAMGAGYNYDRCDMSEGPYAWTGSCPANVQTSGTPIDLCGAQAFSGTATLNVGNWEKSRTMTILNNGHTVQIGFQSDDTELPWTQAMVGEEELAYVVTRSTNSTPTNWTVQQMHLHWGRTDHTDEGSEHYMQGERYAAEAHFVHYNSKYGSFTEAVGSGEADALLVVGIFLESGTTDDSATITAMAAEGITASATATAMSSAVTLSDLFTGTGEFYSYNGGLTTPGCNEIVTWVVMTTTKKVSSSTLSNLWQTPLTPGTTSDGYISDLGNWRPLQELNGRTVYNTAGATSACAAVTEPDFGCSGSSSTSSGAAEAIQAFNSKTEFQAALLGMGIVFGTWNINSMNITMTGAYSFAGIYYAFYNANDGELGTIDFSFGKAKVKSWGAGVQSGCINAMKSGDLKGATGKKLSTTKGLAVQMYLLIARFDSSQTVISDVPMQIEITALVIISYYYRFAEGATSGTEVKSEGGKVEDCETPSDECDSVTLIGTSTVSANTGSASGSATRATTSLPYHGVWALLSALYFFW